MSVSSAVVCWAMENGMTELVWCAVLVVWAVGLAAQPPGPRRFVWLLVGASWVPAFLTYRWLTTPALSSVTG